MKFLKTFESYNTLNEGTDNTSKAVSIYINSLDEDKKTKIKSAKKLASMLNLSIQEGDIYAESQYEDYEGWEKTLDKLRDLMNEIDIDTIYYCYDTDEVVISEPTLSEEDVENGVSDFDWTMIDSEDVKRTLLGNVGEYV